MRSDVDGANVRALVEFLISSSSALLLMVVLAVMALVEISLRTNLVNSANFTINVCSRSNCTNESFVFGMR